MARAKPRKTGHKSHDRVMEQDWEAKQKTAQAEAAKAGGVGHNSTMGLINPDVQNLFSEDEELEEAIKALQKDRKAIRNIAKEEFGIPLRVWAIEKSMRKLDVNVRTEIEQAHTDLKAMLGYQMALNLVERNAEDTPDPVEAAKSKVVGITKASAKAAAKAAVEEEEEEEIKNDDEEDNF